MRKHMGKQIAEKKTLNEVDNESGNEITIFTDLLQFQWPRTHAKSGKLTQMYGGSVRSS